MEELGTSAAAGPAGGADAAGGDDPYAGLLRDMRGPISSIQSYVRTLITRDATLSPTARATVHQVILQQSLRLDAFVDDVVLYVRLLNGGLTVEREPVLLSAVLEEVRHRLGEPDRVVIGDGTEVVVQTDRSALGAALRRLVRNALVYGPRRAPVHVTGGTERGWVVVSVRDAGFGIPETAYDVAVQPFTRAVRAGERRSDGPGLGLAVARELAVLLGGELLLRNANPGLTAALRLPGGP